jgi:hypothetical protein
LTEAYAADLERLRQLTGLPIKELSLNCVPRDLRRDTSTELIEMCARSNQMDAHLFHLAVLIHDAQAPESLV